jgi:hypothetical protein
MPYNIERSGSQYVVVDDKGKTVGTHSTEEEAASQLAALNANVPEASKEDVLRYGRRRRGIGDSHTGVNTGGESMSAADQITELASVIKQMMGEIPGDTSQEQQVTTEATKPDTMDAYDNEMGKKDKPNYASIISERKGKPADGQLYARVIRAAKDKFDVYPSAVANAWVVAEYKRRGGTYKADTTESKTIWDGSLLDPKDFLK